MDIPTPPTPEAEEELNNGREEGYDGIEPGQSVNSDE